MNINAKDHLKTKVWFLRTSPPPPPPRATKTNYVQFISLPQTFAMAPNRLRSYLWLWLTAWWCTWPRLSLSLTCVDTIREVVRIAMAGHSRSRLTRLAITFWPSTPLTRYTWFTSCRSGWARESIRDIKRKRPNFTTHCSRYPTKLTSAKPFLTTGKNTGTNLSSICNTHPPPPSINQCPLFLEFLIIGNSGDQGLQPCWGIHKN